MSAEEAGRVVSNNSWLHTRWRGVKRKRLVLLRRPSRLYRREQFGLIDIWGHDGNLKFSNAPTRFCST